MTALMLPLPLLIVGIVCFALHVYGKYGERKAPMPFIPWLGHNVGYLFTSLGLCVVGVLLRHEIMEPLGFTKEGTFIAILCYGGAHLVSRVIGMKEAAEVRKA
jgi:hypothetical protein